MKKSKNEFNLPWTVEKEIEESKEGFPQSTFYFKDCNGKQVIIPVSCSEQDRDEDLALMNFICWALNKTTVGV